MNVLHVHISNNVIIKEQASRRGKKEQAREKKKKSQMDSVALQLCLCSKKNKKIRKKMNFMKRDAPCQS